MAVQPRDAKEGAWTYDLFQDALADPATCEDPPGRSLAAQT